MSSQGHPFGDEPTHHPPWPYIDPFTQGRLERKCIADGETINFDSLPQMQFWGDDKMRVLMVLKRIENQCNAAQRPLTAVEATALGEHAAHATRYYSWIAPASTAAALALAFYKRRTFSFPFYTPKMKKFDPRHFPTKRYSLLRGSLAVASWHTMRFFAYKPFTWIPTFFFCVSMADQSFLAHSQRDSRLTALIQESRQKAQQRLNQLPRRPVPIPSQPPQQTHDSGYSDDSSYQGNENAAFPSRPDPERFAPAPELPRNTQPNWARTQSSQRDDTDDLFDNDDDASPVAVSARRQEAGQRQTGVPSSSWEYIRSQAKSGTNWERGDSSGQERGWGQLRQDKAQSSRDSNPKTDSYSYSNDDEERERRNYEKEQAQKEFDALLEAERRGDSGSSSSRGWRK